jgi:hypothetical protein
MAEVFAKLCKGDRHCFGVYNCQLILNQCSLFSDVPVRGRSAWFPVVLPPDMNKGLRLDLVKPADISSLTGFLLLLLYFGGNAF